MRIEINHRLDFISHLGSHLTAANITDIRTAYFGAKEGVATDVYVFDEYKSRSTPSLLFEYMNLQSNESPSAQRLLESLKTVPDTILRVENSLGGGVKGYVAVLLQPIPHYRQLDGFNRMFADNVSNSIQAWREENSPNTNSKGPTPAVSPNPGRNDVIEIPPEENPTNK